ncbi:type II secretion system F family protein [Flavobacterium sp. MXW15]|uniref:Type II secretion system F family protein n=1 Tax=Xanthomonas chitinilytica TaxID=2989819 RepID=A0ABT3JXU5_9XANT|nr:type II secretion system F family protein [Xanthomonas sp. H13-6]MCW4454366.1 type II secretion system F family protein [Flavobacterium sp. MXW15]MCW4473328.1 type II secretion system F family protein [Xanthomonas sp. H13-6]
MSWMIALVALMAMAAVLLVMLGLRGLLQAVPQSDRDYQDPLPLALRLLWPLVVAATHLAGPRLKSSQLERAHRSLQSAGQDFVLTPEELYGTRIVSAGAVAVVLLLLVVMLGKGSFSALLFCLAFGLPIGWMYPSLWLGERRKVRTKYVVRDLPVFLDFITMGVEAGLNITGAIEQSVQRGPAGPLSQEFSRMLRDLRAGLPRSESLRRMADRMDISQITSFTSALIQADKVGASLSDTLRAQASQRREERFLRAEKLALEAPVKMMLPLVMFFFPLIFVVLAYFIYLQMKQQGIL